MKRFSLRFVHQSKQEEQKTEELKKFALIQFNQLSQRRIKIPVKLFQL